MDPLSDLLPAMRIASADFTRLEASAPWGIDFPAYHHVKFGVVIRGNCIVTIEQSSKQVTLNQGDCYLLPRGIPFTLSDSLHTPLIHFDELIPRITDRVLQCGDGGRATVIIGGRFIFRHDGIPPILAVLPDLVHFSLDAQELQAMQSTVQLLAGETYGPALGSNRMVDRLTDIFFIQSLRAYIGADKHRHRGWLGAVADEKIGAALRLIHEHNNRPWTLQDIAAKIGMSRSVFAQRFKQIVGVPPMEYLTRSRIQTAAQMLEESNLPISEIAAKSGYDSDASFNKAFKKIVGDSPGKYRKQKSGNDI